MRAQNPITSLTKTEIPTAIQAVFSVVLNAVIP